MDYSHWLLFMGLLGVYMWHRRKDPVHAIPTVGGPSAPLISYIGAFRFLLRAQELIQEGYNKHRGSAFKVAMFDQWLVVLSGQELVEQIRKSPDEMVSPGEGVLFLTQIGKYVHPDVIKDPYHVEIIRHELTRQLSTVLPAILDEIEVVCRELLPNEEDASAALPGSRTMLGIVARVISRAFVGESTCRNPGYLDAAVSFTIDLIKARMIINLFPEALKGFISRLIHGPRNNLRRVVALLEPVVQDRLKSMETSKKSADSPNDMLQWILEEAYERKESVEVVVTRLQAQNFAAIHTSSNTLTHAFFHLLANKDIIEPIREEIENALVTEGWSRSAFDKMWKLDSLLKESQRFSGLNLLGMIRRILQDVTLVDGTYLPAGTLCAFAAQATHSDSTNYERSDKFEPFRFSDYRGSGESARHQYVNTSSDYIAFGRGKHACPGRFFASLELKAILSYLVLNYDMEFEEKGGRPANISFSFSVLPSRDARVVFRKRHRS